MMNKLTQSPALTIAPDFKSKEAISVLPSSHAHNKAVNPFYIALFKKKKNVE